MSKISELSDGGVIQGGDTLIAVRSGGNVKVTYGGSTTANIDGGTIDGTTIGGTTPAAGNFTTGSFTGNVTFGDNDKAIFGAGSDLQIYHTGTNSIIKNLTGEFLLQGDGITLRGNSPTETMLTGDVNGAITLHYDSLAKLATTSTGIDVTGTVTADGLTVDGTATIGNLYDWTIDDSTFNAGANLSTNTTVHFGTTGNNSFNVYTNDTKRVKVGNNGDVSLYEDTGTTAKFFWDASAESLGIGTTTPDNTFHVVAGADGEVAQFTGAIESRGLSIFVETAVDASALTRFRANSGGSAGQLAFNTDGDERMRIDSSGNVGIGSSNPDEKLEVNGDIKISGAASGSAGVLHFGGVSDDTKIAGFDGTASGTPDTMIFYTDTAERMRIDSSGNLLVGKQVSSLGTEGVTLGPNGQHYFTSEDETALKLNRLTTDGEIIQLRKDSSTVGSIGVNGGNNLNIGGSVANHAGLEFVDTAYYPQVAQVGSNGDVDLGGSLRRFKDLYLSNAVYAGDMGLSSGDLFVAIDGDANGITTGYKLRTGVASTSSASHLAFVNPNGIVGTIKTSGSATSFNTSSDYRLKENVVAMSGATERLKQLAPKRFNFIADADVTVDGFLAHEVQSVVPEAITGTHNEVDDDGNPVYQGIDQSKLVPLLVATIQELEARIAALESN